MLLTGGTGFIGAELAVFLYRNHHQIHVLVRPSSDVARLRRLCPDAILHVHQGGLDSLRGILRSATPGVVFHLASCFVAEHTPADVGRLVDSNVAFGAHLLEAMRLEGCGRLINTGTSWQHFHSAGYRPASLYAATKQAFEDVVEFYVDAYELRAITLKLFDTYGPGDTRRKLIPLLVNAAREGRSLGMSPGEQSIDLVHVADVVRAFHRAGNRVSGPGQGHEIFAVSSGAPVTLRDLVALFERLLGRSMDVEFGARPYRDREVMEPWSGGRGVPGWRPEIDLESGLGRLLSPGGPEVE